MKTVSEELHDLENLVKGFSDRMHTKLLEKLYKGWGGWDTCPTEILERKLKEHIKKGFDLKNMIDIGNLAAMIWYRRDKEMIENKAKSVGITTWKQRG